MLLQTLSLPVISDSIPNPHIVDILPFHAVTKTKVALIQVNNSFSEQNYLPLSAGVLISYAKANCKNIDNFEFLVPIYKRISVDKAIEKIADAGLVAFSVYVWNYKISCLIAEKVKQINPETIVLFGGCHVPDNNIVLEEFLKQIPFVDFACTGEGEISFASFLDHFHTRTWDSVPSLSYIKDGKLIRTNPAPRIEDLNNVPSPFLTGIFTPLMEANPNETWIGLWETNRGCPFSCFEENTKIITSRCPNKKAKDVKIGDYLMCLNEETQEITETQVTKTFYHKVHVIFEISFEDESVIKVTPEHPFYVNKKWIEAKDLNLGDEIFEINSRDKISFNKKVANPAKRLEVREKISNTVKQLYKDGFKSRFFEEGFQSTHKCVNEEILNKWREFHSERMKKHNPMSNPKSREQATKTLISRIEDGSVIPFMCTEKYWKQLKNCPNKFEQSFSDILQKEFEDRYKFSGNGSFRIGYYSPDFIDIERKKIIELNGCYWHNCEKCFPNETPLKRDADRIKKFESAGYKVKVVWGHEVKDQEELLKELRNFTHNGKKIIEIKTINKETNVVNFSCYPHENYFANYILSHNCAFCDWGVGAKKRMADFELERLWEEIDWFTKHNVKFVYCCDANFGMYKDRDFAIAKKFVENKKLYGCPEALSVQNTKNSTEASYNIQKEMTKSGLSKGVLLAFQSLHEPTLKAIKRDNIKLKTFYDLQRRFTSEGVETFSDIILGLPEETYETFTEGVSTLMEMGQHNRIQFNNLSILPNSEMGDPEYQKKYGLELIETKMINIHGNLGEWIDNIYETQFLVVSTNSLSREEWVKCRSFAFMVSLAHFNKLLQIPSIIMNVNYKIRYKDIIQSLMDATSPALSKIRNFFVDKACDIQNGGAEYCESKEWLNIWWPADEFAFIQLIKEGLLEDFYKESLDIFCSILPENGNKELLEQAFLLNKNLIKIPFVNEGLEIELTYNIWDIYRINLVGESIAIENGLYKYSINRSSKTWNSWEQWYREVVWYSNKKGAYLYSVI